MSFERFKRLKLTHFSCMKCTVSYLYMVYEYYILVLQIATGLKAIEACKVTLPQTAQTHAIGCTCVMGTWSVFRASPLSSISQLNVAPSPHEPRQHKTICLRYREKRRNEYQYSVICTYSFDITKKVVQCCINSTPNQFITYVPGSLEGSILHDNMFIV